MKKRSSIAIAAACFFLPVRLFADLKANDPAPPLAQSQTVTAYRGETTLIPLRAQGRLANDARFLIRSQPKSGTLGEIQIEQPGIGLIPYVHADENGTGTDGFTFAVQSPGSPVSAPARVRIIVAERPSSFEIPERLEFGPVLTGRESEANLTLKNTGGGLIEGTLKLPPPWTVAGSPRYRLARGEEQILRIRFRPNEERDFVGKAGFSHDPKIGTLLHGEGLRPFAVRPPQVSLQHPLRSEDASFATLKVSNPQDRDLVLKITAPAAILTSAELKVPARGSVDWTLSANPDSLTGDSGEIRLTEGSDEAVVSARVFPAPAVLKTRPAGTLSLGKVRERDSVPGEFQLENQGGSATEIQIETPPSIHLKTPRTLTLGPGQKQAISFTVEPGRPGKFSELILLRYDDRELAVQLVAEVAGADSRVLPGDAAAPPAPADEAPPTPTVAIGASFQTLYVSEQTYHSVTVAWRKPQPAPATYRVTKRRIVSEPNGQVREIWEPLPKVTLGETGNTATARIDGLNPGQRITIRILSLNAEGRLTASSSAFSVASRVYIPWRAPAWLWLVAAIPVMIFLIRLIRKQRQRQRKADLEHLEEFTRL